MTSRDQGRLGRRVLALVGCSLSLGLLGGTTGCQAIPPDPQPAPAPAPASTTPVPPTSSASATPAPAESARLARAIERVNPQTAVFRLRDSSGFQMNTLKVLPYEQGYLGVYHRHAPGGTFEVRVATSTNLRVWHYWSRLDAHGSQPALAAVDGGGYVLAVEADRGGAPGPGKRWLRFRYYEDLPHLLAGQDERVFDAPHTLTAPDRGAEGTPNIFSVRTDGTIGRSEIEVGFHYLEGGVDRQARGVLSNFSRWAASPYRGLDRALDQAGLRGKHGDRDTVRLGGEQFALVEAQSTSDPFWQVALLDTRSGRVRRLQISTPGRSRSFANPTAVRAVLPNGKPGLIVTLFLPRTGAAPGEAGQLLYYNEL